MIIVIAASEVTPEKQTAFIEAVKASGAVEGVHAERGNISYDLVSSVIEPGKLFMIERWEDMESLKEHSAGANLMTIGRISAEYGVKTDIKMFSAEALN